MKCQTPIALKISTLRSQGGVRTNTGGELHNHNGYSVIVNDVATGRFPGRKVATSPFLKLSSIFFRFDLADWDATQAPKFVRIRQSLLIRCRLSHICIRVKSVVSGLTLGLYLHRKSLANPRAGGEIAKLNRWLALMNTAYMGLQIIARGRSSTFVA